MGGGARRGADEDGLDHISWEEWFDKFGENDLAFLYQEEKADGGDSTFFKLIPDGDS